MLIIINTIFEFLKEEWDFDRKKKTNSRNLRRIAFFNATNFLVSLISSSI